MVENVFSKWQSVIQLTNLKSYQICKSKKDITCIFVLSYEVQHGDT